MAEGTGIAGGTGGPEALKAQTCKVIVASASEVAFKANVDSHSAGSKVTR